MSQIPVRWKPVMCKACSGDDVSLDLGQDLDYYYRGTLLARILSMPRGRPIGYDAAIRMLSEKQDEIFNASHLGPERFGVGPGQYGWYSDNFVEWMSSQGYHIELTGDEFESYALSDQVA